VVALKNVLVIGATNRQDLIDPAVLRPGRLDVKIKVERPDREAAADIFRKYLTPDLPIGDAEARQRGAEGAVVLQALIDEVVGAMYSPSEDNAFLEVTYASGDKERLYFKDFASGAMIESVVRRAKTRAVKRYIARGEKGITRDDLLTAAREEFSENEELPNTTNPDNWAKIAGRQGERIVHVKALRRDTEKPRSVDTVVPTGQYL
jgi:proteasome-associated ATPase